MTQDYDVLVAGGGAAGLSAALTLARARRSVLVVDAGTPRNAVAAHAHNYLGREGVSPAGLLAAGRAEVAGYGGEVADGTVVSARPCGAADRPRFEVSLDSGPSVTARRLLVATGLADELPDLPGVAQLWGRDVLHCPYCHGWEVRDQAIGILGGGPLAVHQALLFRQWSAAITLFRHTLPALAPGDLARLAARDITVADGEVAALEVAAGRLAGVRLRAGGTVPVQALAVQPRFTARAQVLASLGIEPAEQLIGGHVIGSYVPAGPGGATAVPGVWVAGNVADLQAQLISSAAAGLSTAAALNADLVEEDIRNALAVGHAAQSREAAAPS
jgi:thioredoxin reductase